MQSDCLHTGHNNRALTLHGTCLQRFLDEGKERTVGGVFFLFSYGYRMTIREESGMVNKDKKTCRKKQHVYIDSIKEMPILICGRSAVGGKYKSTRYSFG